MTVFIFAVAAVVFGVVAFEQLAVDLLPDITYPSVTVRTDYEGAAPAEIETLVTRPIEDAVGVVNNVVAVTSSSRADTSEVTLEFAWGTDMDFASLDVRERLDVIRLPIDADRPVLLRYDPSLDPILRVGITGIDDLIRLRLLAEEEVRRSLERVEGVAAALVSGGLEEEIQVEVDERKLTSLGLDIRQITSRLAAENVNLTGGRLREGQTEYLVRTINEIVRPDELQQIVVDRSGGATVRLEDVARVYKGTREREIITRINGLESVEVAVYKEGGTNTVTVADDVREQLDDLRDRLRRLDPTLDLTVVTDQSRYIRESVSAVLSSAVMGGALAVVVLFLFLRSARNTVIIAISIPVSVMATFFLMFVSDVSLNIMSLGGLTLGVGLLLDNSIVVLEAIERQRERGLDLVEAARVGASEVGSAVIASTITTVCVFVPIVFIEGIAGQLFGDQALTVTYSLLVSLVVALTVIPMLASRDFGRELDEGFEDDAPPRARSRPVAALQRGATSGVVRIVRFLLAIWLGLVALLRTLLSPILVAFDAGFEVVRRLYDRCLDAVLRRPFPAIGLGLLLLLVALWMAGRLGRELVPELIQGEVWVDLELPPGSRLEVTDRRVQGVEQYAASLDGVETVYSLIGSSNEQGGVAGETREHTAQVTLLLQQPSDREREDARINDLRSFLDDENALYSSSASTAGTAGTAGGEGPQAGPLGRTGGFEYRFGRPSYFSFKTPIEIEIRGHNLAQLERVGSQVLPRLRAIEGLVDVESSTEGGNPELQILFDRDRLAAFGLTVGDIGGLLRSKIQGDIATDIHRDDRNIEIRLRSDERFRDSVRDLENLDIRAGETTSLPLSAVAEVIETIGPAEIRRADGSRVARITANLEGRDLGSVSEDIETVMAGSELPVGFSYELGGQREEMETSFDSMRLAILLAVFMVYLVMASQFESLLHPLVILFSVPLSVIGAVVLLVLTNTTISIVVLIGAILLAGIVVNNAIVLIDYTNRLRRGESSDVAPGEEGGEAGGLPRIEALREAGRVRLRPILMTTATTVLGLLPLALGLGEGSELRAPMAITVIGGLLASTALTLLVVPALYAVLDSWFGHSKA